MSLEIFLLAMQAAGAIGDMVGTGAQIRLGRAGATLEQEQIALKQRAAGKANAETIRTQADNAATLQLAQAKGEAALIRGQGDAEAAKIYNAAYQKNPQFAAFYLKLEAYRKGFTQASSTNNFLILNTKDDALPRLKS